MLIKAVATDNPVVDIFKFADISNSRVQASNGIVTVDETFAITDFDAVVPLQQLLSALNICGNPEFKKTDQSLMVKCGKFKARLALNNDAYPKSLITGETFQEFSGLGNQLTILKLFAGTQVGWMKGFIFERGYIYATDGRSMARFPTEIECERAIVPLVAAPLFSYPDPIGIAFTSSSVYIKYMNTSWASSVLLAERAPDLATKFADIEDTIEVTETLEEAVRRLAGFGDVIESDGTKLVARTNDSAAAEDIEGLPVFNAHTEHFKRCIEHFDRFSLNDKLLHFSRADGAEAILSTVVR